MASYPVTSDVFKVFERNEGRKYVLDDRIVIVTTHRSSGLFIHDNDHVVHLNVYDHRHTEYDSKREIVDDECRKILESYLLQ
jgi:hypothetical protein